MSGMRTELTDDVIDLVMDAPEPFLIPDVTPAGASKAEVFHIVRDMVDAGEIVHCHDGYWRAVPRV